MRVSHCLKVLVVAFVVFPTGPVLAGYLAGGNPTGGGLPARAPGVTLVQDAQGGWDHYVNARYGSALDYPADQFEQQPPLENGDGLTFVSSDGKARFIVFGSHNVFGSTLKELAEQDLVQSEDEKITYRRDGENWFVHSGMRGGDFFLRKVVLGSEVVHTFEISYPRGDKPRMDPIAARMAQSFAAEEGAVSLESGNGEPFAQPWTSHGFEGFTLEAPEDWTKSVEGDTLVLKAPDGRRSLMIWWWFSDEPLLGYSDILSHRKIAVAGNPALWIHTRSEDVDTISVAFDKGRKDKKRLHFVFTATDGVRLDDGDPDFDRILESLSLGGAKALKKSDAMPAANRRVATPQDATPAPVARSAEVNASEESGRAWLGWKSVEVPTGWEERRGEDDLAIVLARPDGGAEIILAYWPVDRPMPSDAVETVEQDVIIGRPATILRLNQGRERAVQVFFDEPRSDGSRLTLSYRAIGEALEDGLPIFELALASLDDSVSPPAGTPMPVLSGPVEDPFGDLDMSAFEGAGR